MQKKYILYLASLATFICALSLSWCIRSLSNVHGNTHNDTTTKIVESSESTTTVSETTSEETIPETTTAQKKIQPVKAILLSDKKLTLCVNSKKKLSVKIQYKKSKKEKESVIWTSSNTQVATVSSTGKVKAVSVGTATITCQSLSGKVSAKCKLTVIDKYNKVKSIKLNEKKIRLNPNDNRYLNATITYKKTKYPTNEPVIWKSKNKKIATVSTKGVVHGKKKGSTYITVTSKYTGISVKCKVVVGKTKYIAITFDDGPGPYTNKLLNALEKADAKATFLLVGSKVNSYAKTAKREYNLGMQIGSHTWSHANLNAVSTSEIKSQIKDAKKAIKKATGVSPSIFRPPYGNYNQTVSKTVDVPMIYWSVDTLDWKNRNATTVKNYVVSHAYDGAVVLLHDIHPTSVDGLINALPTLIKKNYELVTTEELFKIKGIEMKKGVMYFDAK